MVSFSCEGCGDVLTKKKLDGHRNQCRGATYTCLDCMTHFQGTEYRSHTSCISEAQKYQGHLYREKGSNKRAKTEKRQSTGGQDASQAMVPRGAYVEDAAEGDDMNAIAVIDVPPRAPTPPPAAEPMGELPSNVNVFDFLVPEDTPNGNRHALEGPDERRLLEQSTPHTTGAESQLSQFSNGDGSQYLRYGYSYGNAPIAPGLDRYESMNDLTESQQSQLTRPPPSFVTPGPKDARKVKKDRTLDKSEKKRKRGNPEELDLNVSKRPVSRDDFMSDAPMTSGGRVLHSGLTGGLSRLITDQEFYDDRVDAGPTPISPLKRSKRDKDGRNIKDDRRKSSYNSHTSSRVPSGKVPDDQQNGHKKRDSHHRDSLSSDENSSLSRQRQQRKAIDYPERAGSVQPTSENQLAVYTARAELFMSFITKGPESERGCSINKVLKRYHGEMKFNGEARNNDDKGRYNDDKSRNKDDKSRNNDDKGKVNEDKALWKGLRVRRNSRGEIVLFA